MSWRSIALILALVAFSKVASAEVDPVAEGDRLTALPDSGIFKRGRFDEAATLIEGVAAIEPRPSAMPISTARRPRA